MIIDHVEGLEIPSEVADQYYNELEVLRTLAAGLELLNREVSKYEDEISERLSTDTTVHYSYGNDPRLANIPRRLIYCAFRWYSVTVCDYVKIVGWLANGRDTKKANEYLGSVIPYVRNWRNKVGAHLALTDPREDDTPADLLITSTAFDMGFVDGAFTVGSLTVIKDGSVSRYDRLWSLTHTHRELTSRYAWTHSPV